MRNRKSVEPAVAIDALQSTVNTANEIETPVVIIAFVYFTGGREKNVITVFYICVFYVHGIST